MRPEVESEFKLRARDRIDVAAVDAAVRDAGFTCTAAVARRHVDIYLDDALGSLQRAGIGLRLRHADGERRLTCKTRGERRGSLFVRDEWEAPWAATSPPRTAAELPPSLRDTLEPFVLDRPLQPMLELATQRDRRTLRSDDRDLCELAIDQVQAAAAGRSATFVEIELEVIDDLPTCERLADRLLQRLPLQAADDDKPGHASALLGLQRAGAATPALRASTPIGAALAAIAAPHLAALQAAEVDVRRGDGDAPLHAMRTAARRLRELVRACRDLWPKAERKFLLTHLAETGRRLGTLRDLDVLLADLQPAIAHLPEPLRRPGPALSAWIGRQRQETRERVLTWLRGGQRLADQRRLVATVANAGATSDEPLGDSLGRRLAKATRRVRKLVRAVPADLPFEPLHRLRIACKRLRYLADEFVDLPGHDYRRSLAVVTRLQQSLGTVCDCETTMQRLLDQVAAAGNAPGEPLPLAAMLGGLATLLAARGDKARRRAARHLAQLDRKKVYRRFTQASATDATLAP